MPDLLKSLVRTGVPVAVASVVGFLADLGVVVSGDLKSDLTALLTFGAGVVYYVGVRLAGRRWPWVERLLGSPEPPTYKSASDSE